LSLVVHIFTTCDKHRQTFFISESVNAHDSYGTCRNAVIFF
jgi:hypothetical protein